uniref:protein-tyrosine-phosphatase n=1 Tax=Callithrix jacchus TaxID=9483 RepID=A0A5F4VWW7_CALJA
MKVTSLDGRQLRKMLRKEAAARCVVLDCRPYLAFAASSVRGSLNVNLNSVVLRRARGGTVSARYVLPDEAARARLLQEGGGGVAAVVVLDQGSRHWQKLREESAARVVLTSLLACLPAGPRVYFLKGGYETFYSEYPECCVDVKPISQEMIESERALISQCGKPVSYRPAYDQGGPVEILPFLYLGSAYHASKCEFLANLHITALLNVSRRTSEACTTHLHYKWIPVEDSHTADISSHFQEAIDFIASSSLAAFGVRTSCVPPESEQGWDGCGMSSSVRGPLFLWISKTHFSEVLSKSKGGIEWIVGPGSESSPGTSRAWPFPLILLSRQPWIPLWFCGYSPSCFLVFLQFQEDALETAAPNGLLVTD